VGANTVILPNTKIGDYAVIGAGSVVSRDIPPASVAWGNPAKVRYTLDEFMQKHRQLSKTSHVYDRSYGFKQGVNEVKKKQMYRDLEKEMGYIAY
jgi:serine acetyltransferase